MIIGTQRPDREWNVNIVADPPASDPKDVILDDVVMKDLNKISQKYTDDLKRRASEYADQTVSGSFDSDEDITSKVTEDLNAVYGEKKSKLASKTENALTDLKEKKESYDESASLKRDKLLNRYQSNWQKALESLTKKGMTHSSTALLSKEKIAADYAAEAAAAERAYNRKIQTIDQKIAKWKSDYENALKNYEITYAIELEEKVDRLKEKRDRLVENYNNSHSRERAQAYNDYLAGEQERNAAYEEAEGDYTDLKKENYRERYDYLIDALTGKSKTRIARFLKQNGEELKEYLGLYYDDFVKEVS